MRVDVLAIASPGQAYDALKAVAGEHAKAAPPGFRVEFVYGDCVSAKPTPLDAHYDDVPETMIPGILDKSIAAMRAALDSADPPDFIVRTNLSTWFHWDRLAEWLETAPRTGVAAGYSPCHTHLCGCCIVLSADVARALVDYGGGAQEGYDATLIDDLAIAKALGRLGVATGGSQGPKITWVPGVHWIPRIDILSDAIVGHGTEVGQDPLETFQIRIKSCLGGDADRMRDATIMANLMRAYRRGARDVHELLQAGLEGVEVLVAA